MKAVQCLALLFMACFALLNCSHEHPHDTAQYQSTNTPQDQTQPSPRDLSSAPDSGQINGDDQAQGDGQDHDHDDSTGHAHDDGQDHDRDDAAGHAHGEDQEHDHDDAAGHSHGEEQDHDHDDAAGHAHGEVQDQDHDDAAGHSHGEGQDQDHDDAAGHAHDDGQDHGHDDSAGHSHDDGQGHDHGGSAGHSHEDEGPPTKVFTLFSDTFQLFMEVELPVQDKPFTAIAHFTRLADWQPKQDGKVIFNFYHPDGDKVQLPVGKPSRPGIYIPSGRLPKVGQWRMEVDFADQRMVVGELAVTAGESDLDHGQGGDADSIGFLIEQQWKIPFKVEPAGLRKMGGSRRVFARFTTAPGRKAVIKAPADGVLAIAGRRAVQPGDTLESKQPVTALIPAPPDRTQPASILAGKIKAEAEQALAQSELKRLETLFTKGVVAEYRVLAAKTRLNQADAVVAEHRKKLAAIQGQNGEATPSSMAVTSPFAGRVSAVFAAPGTYVEAGDPLVELIDRGVIRLEAMVPESQIHHLDGLEALEIQMGGHSHHLHLDGGSGVRLAYRGLEIDPKTKTLPVVFEIEHGEDFIPGTTVSLHLITNEGEAKLAIPESALIFDGGFRVFYVMLDGETFERRVARLGRSTGGWVEVNSDLVPGEFVVTEGAYLVRLAAMKTGEVGHGHSH